MLEKKITPSILKIMRDDPRFASCLVEIKVSKGKTLPSTALKEHQRHALTVATESSMYFKVPDMGYQNPADSFILKKAQSYLVIYFDTPFLETWVLKIQDVPLGSISLDYARGVGVKLDLK